MTPTKGNSRSLIFARGWKMLSNKLGGTAECNPSGCVSTRWLPAKAALVCGSTSMSPA